MWMKVDDRLHSHRKTRAVTKTHPDKARDIAPMGLWVAAGSWSAQNGTHGWIPEEELDRWDDDWKMLSARLVDSGYWWPEDRGGEPGYGFHDWRDYNPSPEAASASGTYGNHVRWHINEGIVNPDCEHCPKEPESADSPPDSHPDSGGDIGTRSGGDIGSDRSTQPHPTPPEPDPHSSASADAERAAEFEAWWTAYPRKRDKGHAAKAYKAARKKTDAGTLLRAIQVQTPTLTARGMEYTPYPATWLSGERWGDQPDRAAVPAEDWMRRKSL